MKIGLEFEGVIRNYSTGEITRWSKMPEEAKIGIKKMMFVRREKIDPCDRYDALAEVRTPPIENPTEEKLINALFTEIETATNAFVSNGYYIQWFEQPIPQKLHDEILHDFAVGDPDGKKDKYTQTIRNGKVEKFESVGNLFRGGGLHISISSIPAILASALVMDLHNDLRGWHRDGKFQSHYRTNLLYRTRCEYLLKPSSPNYGSKYDEVVEYMSHGFNIAEVAGWRKRYAPVSSEKWYLQEYDHAEIAPFIWAKIVIENLKRFYKVCGELR